MKMDSVTPRAVPVYGERESIAARINRRPRQADLIAIMAPIFSRFEEEAVRPKEIMLRSERATGAHG